MSLDFKRRLIGLQEKMSEIGLDVVIYGSCQNFQYLTGLPIDWRSGIDLGSAANNVFVAREGLPILTLDEAYLREAHINQQTWIKDVRILKGEKDYGEMIASVLSDLCVKVRRLGLGDHVWGSTTTETAKYARDASFYSAEALMDHLRLIKEPGEIERLRRVADLTDRVMENVVPKIREGVTQRELEFEIEFQGRSLGASQVSFPPTAGFVRSGSEISTDPLTYPKEKGLLPGTSIAFDIGFVMDGYCSDFGRSFYFGPASKDVLEGYNALHQGVIETVDGMYDGSMLVCDLFPTLEKTLDALGYGSYLRAEYWMSKRQLGHSIGVEVHEPPWLNPSNREPLRANMVMALEPKIWRAGQYYLRVEDMVLVGSRKTEFLSNFDRKLFQL